MAPSTAVQRNVRPGLPLLLAVVGSVLLSFAIPEFPSVFISGAAGHMSTRSFTSTLPRRATTNQYPELSRVEELIYDSCMIKEGEQQIECLRVADKLTKFHADTALECSLDDFKCVVLGVLDRLCTQIQGQDGFILLNRLSSTVMAMREKFEDWEIAFAETDTDSSGDIDIDELKSMLKSMGTGLTESEASAIFFAADANGDGVISKQEFFDFMISAVFADEPLRAMQMDPLPRGQPNFEEYMRWTGRGTGSWENMATIR